MTRALSLSFLLLGACGSSAECATGEQRACECVIAGEAQSGQSTCTAGTFGDCDCTPRDASIDAPDGGADMGSPCDCEDGETETRLTRACGTESRSCSSCEWSAWERTAPDQADPECFQGDTFYGDDVNSPDLRAARSAGCGTNGPFRIFACGSDCRWEEELSECGGGCPGEPRTEPADAEEICVPGGVHQIGCDEEFIRDTSMPGGLEDVPRSCFPRHPVRLSAYYVDRYQVTVRRYRECVADGECTALEPATVLSGDVLDESDAADTWPVWTATYQQAEAFCRWDGAELLTGAQWERMSQGHSHTEWHLPWSSDWRGIEQGPTEPFAERTRLGFLEERSPSGYEDDAKLNIGAQNLYWYFEWTRDLAEEPYPPLGPIPRPPPPLDPSFPGEGQHELRGGNAGGSSFGRLQVAEIQERNAMRSRLAYGSQPGTRTGQTWGEPKWAAIRCARPAVAGERRER